MTIRVGKWDCPVCGQEGILGPEKACTSCGSPRPANVKFYLTDNSEIVKDEEKIKEAKSGADWVCSYCGAHNKHFSTHCHACGNDKEVDDGDKHLEQSINYTDGRKNITSNKNINKKTKAQNKINQYPNIKQSKTSKFKKIFLGILISIFSLLGISLIPVSEVVDVTGFSWKREIALETYKQVVEEDWSIPSGGTKIREFEAVHHYKKVPDGYETKTRTVQKQIGTEKVKVGEKNLGNGYFEDVYEERPVYEETEETYEEQKFREEPVYETKYEYSIYRWVETKPYITHEQNKKPYWQEENKISTNTLRETSRKELYFIHYNSENKNNKKIKVSKDLWENCENGDKLKHTKSFMFNWYDKVERE